MAGKLKLIIQTKFIISLGPPLESPTGNGMFSESRQPLKLVSAMKHGNTVFMCPKT